MRLVTRGNPRLRIETWDEGPGELAGVAAKGARTDEEDDGPGGEAEEDFGELEVPGEDGLVGTGLVFGVEGAGGVVRR